MTGKAGNLTNRTLQLVERGMNYISAGFIFLLMFAVSLDAVWRMITDKSFAGIYEGCELVLPVIVFMALAYTQAERGHVRVELVLLRMPSRLRVTCEVIALILIFGIGVFLTWRTGIVAIESILRKEFSGGLYPLPIWASRLVVPLGSFVLCARVAMQIYHELADFGRAASSSRAMPNKDNNK